MALFRTANKRANKLEELDEIGFKNELEMQRTTEKNLQDILGLDFVCSEFSVKDCRIDTLAFDKEAKSFIIIEYKIGKSSSVVDQGMTYLSLMLENRAEFVLEYNRIKEEKMDKRSVDWSQSKVIFISHTFTRQQKGAANFMDFPVDMWEVKKYKNNLVDYKQVKKSAQTSIKELFGKRKKMVAEENSIERIMREIKTYTEEDHLDGCNEIIKDLYNKFSAGILKISDTIEIKVRGTYIGFDTHVNIVGIKIYARQLTMWINMPKGTLTDPGNITTDVSEVGHHGNGDYQINIKSDKYYGYILYLVKQSLEYRGERR